MTTTSHIGGGSVIVWPEYSNDAEYAYEHAIVAAPNSGSISLEQNGSTITIPLYALPKILRAMRIVGKTAEGK